MCNWHSIDAVVNNAFLITIVAARKLGSTKVEQLLGCLAGPKP